MSLGMRIILNTLNGYTVKFCSLVNMPGTQAKKSKIKYEEK